MVTQSHLGHQLRAQGMIDKKQWKELVSLLHFRTKERQKQILDEIHEFYFADAISEPPIPFWRNFMPLDTESSEVDSYYIENGQLIVTGTEIEPINQHSDLKFQYMSKGMDSNDLLVLDPEHDSLEVISDSLYSAYNELGIVVTECIRKGFANAAVSRSARLVYVRNAHLLDEKASLRLRLLSSVIESVHVLRHSQFFDWTIIASALDSATFTVLPNWDLSQLPFPEDMILDPTRYSSVISRAVKVLCPSDFNEDPLLRAKIEPRSRFGVVATVQGPKLVLLTPS